MSRLTPSGVPVITVQTMASITPNVEKISNPAWDVLMTSWFDEMVDEQPVIAELMDVLIEQRNIKCINGIVLMYRLFIRQTQSNILEDEFDGRKQQA